jgi:hypothetical protein
MKELPQCTHPRAHWTRYGMCRSCYRQAIRTMSVEGYLTRNPIDLGWEVEGENRSYCLTGATDAEIELMLGALKIIEHRGETNA